MRNHSDTFIHNALLAGDVGELKRIFLDFLSELQIDLVSYHYLTAGFKRLSLTKGFRISTFPEEFINYYVANDCFEFDPIIQESYKRNVPFFWNSFLDRDDLTDAQKEYISRAQSYGILGGLAVPVYALPGDIAYFSLGSSKAELALPRARQLELQLVCQSMHTRYNELSRTAKTPALSKREIQVLELIAGGKQNAAISETLGISPNTVDTLVRRCFEKLGVTSRVEAALAGVSMGLILP